MRAPKWARVVVVLSYSYVGGHGGMSHCVEPLFAFSLCPEIYNGLSSAFRRKVEASFSERCGGTVHSVSSMAYDYLHIGYSRLKPTVSVRLKAELRRTPVGIKLRQ